MKFDAGRVKESGTATQVPVGSRTTVQNTTQEDLTSGFDMGPGITPPLWPCTTLLRILLVIESSIPIGQRPTKSASVGE